MQMGLETYGLGVDFFVWSLLPFLVVASMGLAFIALIKSDPGGKFLKTYTGLTQATVLAAMASFPSQDLLPLFVEGKGAKPADLIRDQAVIYGLMGCVFVILRLHGNPSRFTIVTSVCAAWFTGFVFQYKTGLDV